MKWFLTQVIKRGEELMIISFIMGIMIAGGADGQPDDKFWQQFWIGVGVMAASVSLLWCAQRIRRNRRRRRLIARGSSSF